MYKYLINKKPEIPSNEFNFRVRYPFQKRLSESEEILKKHKDFIPIIIEKADGTSTKEIDKHKWLLPKRITVSQFIYMISKRIEYSKPLFLFVNNDYLPKGDEQMGDLYEKYKDNDNFMYCSYSNDQRDETDIGHILGYLKFW
jgi:GABA(A) receptor-associated protein